MTSIVKNRIVQIGRDLKQPLQVAYVDIGSLQPDPKNPRVHTKKQLHQIARSIESFGFNVPILVDADLKVIAGHGRLQAVRFLDWDKVPIIKLEHLTPAQRSAFMIADNRLTENSSWDERLLGEQLKILSELELDFDLEVTGFEMGEIDVFIEGFSTEEGGKDDPADFVPDPGPAVTKAGDLWCLGKHRVFCGDSLDPANYATLMDGAKANLVVADPPYNVAIDGHATGLGKIRHREFPMATGEMSRVEFTEFLKKAMSATHGNSTPESLAYWFMDWRHMVEMLSAGESVYSDLLNLCVWAKNSAGMGSFYRSGHELVFVFKHEKGSHRNNIQLGQFGRYRTNVWNYPSANSFSRSQDEGNLLALHPTVKPVALVADAILDCTARGELVLDPFLGSGTTVIAAERVGRVCYGLELDPLYIDTIIRRWQKFSGLTATLAATGESFRIREEASDESR